MVGFGPAEVRRRVAVFCSLIVATAAFAIVPLSHAADAAGTVISTTALTNAFDFPVPGISDQVSIGVDNTGTATATHVVTTVPVPSGGTVDHVSDICAVASGTITCTFGTIAADGNDGANMFITFAASRRSQRELERARRPARLRRQQHGSPGRQRRGRERRPEGIVRQRARCPRLANDVPRSHTFDNAGPTAAANATVSGSVTGGTIVPGSFNFFSCTSVRR